jgi:diguanylate cyclase (GGDEF)-like protein/PAS domain S-box-containing protein
LKVWSETGANMTPAEWMVEDVAKLLIEGADDAFFFYNFKGKLLYVNPAFEKITGYTTQELYDKNFIPYVHPDDQEWTMSLWDGLFKGECFEDVEYRIVKKNGDVGWSLSTWKIVLGNDGEQIGIQGKQRDITKRKLLLEKLKSAKKLSERLAKKDELTGLNNRREFFERGAGIFNQVSASEHPVSVIMMDIDDFKNVNDTYGHIVGDQTLQLISRMLQKLVRDNDIVARVGGEEFAFVLPETSLNKAVSLAERMRKKIANAALIKCDERFRVTASFGIYSCPVDSESLAAMLIKADKALYVAKRNGRNRIQA